MSAGPRSGDPFAGSREQVDAVLGWLEGEQAAGLQHGELEEQLGAQGRELMRRFLADHLELRAIRERRLAAEQVIDAGGVTRPAAEPGHIRPLATVFGEVEVRRIGYRRRGQTNLYPADAALNLPEEKHSHGLRQLAAVEAARGSYDEMVAALDRATGQKVGKRQGEQLATAAAVDFEGFYATRKPPPGSTEDLLVLQADGKGIVMRPGALRPATAKAAGKATHKLATRLSKGEKLGRKRMAELGAVYDATPVVRTPADICPTTDAERADAQDGPKATNKWLVASVAEDTAKVIAAIFDEAERRDPAHTRAWVALVDGANHQIDRITAEAKARGVAVVVLVDVIHVIEYIWKAAWAFHAEADPAAEAWVACQLLAVLGGGARKVAAAIRSKATKAGLDATRRKGADEAAAYLTNKAPYLDYPTALAGGWPIATGVIEGACRHIVADRMDVTGARWSVAGAEAVLKLRAIRSNGDWEEYWRYRLVEERRRVHESRYLNGSIPRAA